VVVSEDPSAGTGVSKGSTVTVVVNKPKCAFDQFGIQLGCDNGGQGQGQVAVPNVVGQNMHDARKALRDAGFQVDVGGGDGDTIAAQVPNGSSQAARGSTVQLFRGQGD
jgi:beta-lactam-binding protein with PASTA domain